MAFPSTNNSFLGTASLSGLTSNVDVDLYTGTALVNIPITSLASNSISIPVSLSYTGGRGIRVQDYASFVGLGWQLNAGGSISRVVRGFPDEQPNGYLGNGTMPGSAIGTGGQWGQVIANNLRNNVALTSSQNNALYGSYGSPPTADGEPDIFNIKTPFFSLQFTFDENGNPVFSNNTGIQIITSKFYNYTGSAYASFEIIDDKGNEYYFGSSNATIETSTTNLYGNSVTFPTTWYLDKIVTYNLKDIITFTYSNYSSLDLYRHFRSIYSISPYGVLNTDTSSYLTTVNQPKFLTTINSSLGEVDFNYITSGRLDDPNSVILSNIYLKGLNTSTVALPNLIQSYGFNYSYFGSPSSDPKVLRLRLDNITIAGTTSNTNSPVTYKSFLYNNAYNLPSRADMTATDFWGYYASPTSNPYNLTQQPNLSYASIAVLTSVTDITGLTNTFTYQLNDYYNQSSNMPVGGLRVSQLTQSLTTGETLNTTYQYYDNSGHSTGQILSNSYAINTFNAGCGVTQFFSESPSNFYDLNGNFIGYSTIKVTPPSGGYTLYSFSNFNNPGGYNFSDSLKYVAGVSGIPDITSSISFAYKRGILIDKSVYNSNGQILSEDKVPLTSFYSLTSPVQKDSWAIKWNWIFASAGGYSCGFSAQSTYSASIENFRPTQTQHIDYDANGNAITATTNLTYLSGNSVAQNNNRLIQLTSTTDSKGNTHTQTFNYPGDSNIPLITSSERSAITNMISSNNISAPIHIADNKNGVIKAIHNSYSLFSYGIENYAYLTTISNYNSGTLVKQQNLNYDFGVTSNILSSSTLGGKSTGITYGYNSCYPIAKIVNASSAVASTSAVTSGNTVVISNGNSSTPQNIPFTVGASGTITLTLTWTSLPPPGSTNYAIINYSISGPSGFSPPVNASICISSNFMCSGYGHTVNVTFPSSPPGNYILTITNTQNPQNVFTLFGVYYPGSNLVSTYSNEFYYEGFEQGNYFTSNVVTGPAHTGNCYYNGSFNVPFILPNNRSYVIQWWSGQNDQWTFNEQPYTGPITLSGIIDDIRIFPTDAQMSSFTYNPLVGKTGEIDPSGRTMTYEYDGLGRVNIVRDNEKNILSKTCYNFAGQTVNCIATALYSNSAISQSFTKNNCPNGGTGSSVIYTVPAETYTSTISQADADAKATFDMNTSGQNYANTNGTCTAGFFLNVVDNNSTYSGYTIQLSGNGAPLNFTVPNHGANSVGPITPGTYNILISPPAGSTYGLMSILSISGNSNLYSSGSTSSFSSITLGPSSYNTINIY